MANHQGQLAASTVILHMFMLQILAGGQKALIFNLGFTKYDAALPSGVETGLKKSTSARMAATPLQLGAYYIPLSIGSPAKHINGVIDTGSGIVHTACKPCSGSGCKNMAHFDPAKSSTSIKAPCASSSCEAICGPSYDCRNDDACSATRCSCGVDSGTCKYAIEYADNAHGAGTVYSDLVSSPLLPGLPPTRLSFGCANNASKDMFSANATMYIGLDYQPGSLYMQLVSQKVIEDSMSWCLGDGLGGGSASSAASSQRSGNSTAADDDDDATTTTTTTSSRRLFGFKRAAGGGMTGGDGVGVGSSIAASGSGSSSGLSSQGSNPHLGLLVLGKAETTNDMPVVHAKLLNKSSWHSPEDIYPLGPWVALTDVLINMPGQQPRSVMSNGAASSGSPTAAAATTTPVVTSRASSGSSRSGTVSSADSSASSSGSSAPSSSPGSSGSSSNTGASTSTSASHSSSGKGKGGGGGAGQSDAYAMLLDTGTTFIKLPYAVWMSFMPAFVEALSKAGVKVSDPDATESMLLEVVLPEETDAAGLDRLLPTVTFVLSGTAAVPLAPSKYLVEPSGAPLAGKRFLAAFYPGGSREPANGVLGNAFLNGLYVRADRAEGSLTFGLVGSCGKLTFKEEPQQQQQQQQQPGARLTSGASKRRLLEALMGGGGSSSSRRALRR